MALGKNGIGLQCPNLRETKFRAFEQILTYDIISGFPANSWIVNIEKLFLGAWRIFFNSLVKTTEENKSLNLFIPKWKLLKSVEIKSLIKFSRKLLSM